MDPKTRIIPPLLAILMTLVGGCTRSNAPVEALATAPPPQSTPEPDTEADAKRFQDSTLDGRTAVESALEISEKYARLSDQTVALRAENQQLHAENERLNAHVASLEDKLAQTQKELNEANDLLIDMIDELNNWKNNVLGFRGEMRNAAKAQLEALLKVLELLGGEAEAGTLGQRHAATLDPRLYGAQEPNSSTALSGEPNALP
jgi:peptidoglycan hydrolase CwlO-like protein